MAYKKLLVVGLGAQLNYYIRVELITKADRHGELGALPLLRRTTELYLSPSSAFACLQ